MNMTQKGMDISYYQGKVDFTKAAADGIQFAILRAGYGQTVDERFYEYVKGCKAAGIKVRGVYLFSYALNEEEAVKEAKDCLAWVKKAGLGKSTIVFYDFEGDTVKQAAANGVILGKKQCVAFTRAFCEYVESKGYKAGIYSNIDYYKNMYTKALISKYIYWLADYADAPNYPCAFQQYTSVGRVKGIKGNVDLDYYFGTAAAPAKKKTVNQLAKEVIAGKWGEGDARKKALEKAGYNYDAVQKKVNEMLKADTKKSVDAIAKEVIQGKWGNGEERKKALEKAGYNYNTVQKRVNALLK